MSLKLFVQDLYFAGINTITFNRRVVELCPTVQAPPVIYSDGSIGRYPAGTIKVREQDNRGGVWALGRSMSYLVHTITSGVDHEQLHKALLDQ